MSLRKHRAQKHARRELPVQDIDNDELVQGDGAEEAKDDLELVADDQVQDGFSAEHAAKRQEIWDAFREEHNHALEQLPLSLHRSYALIRELDQEVQDDTSQLLRTLRTYLSARTAIAQRHATTTDTDVPMDVDQPLPTESPLSLVSFSIPPSGTEALPSEHPTPSVQSQSLSTAKLPSTRELLRGIARLTDDIMEASNEKVNLARFACDVIDRHSRDLERAIKEQETSLSVGLRPGTHLASIILPDVVVPPVVRAPRVVHSPIPDDEDLIVEAPPDPEPKVAEPEPEPPIEEKDKSRRRGRGRPPRKKDDASSARKGSSSSPQRPILTVTVPPLAAVSNSNLPPPPDPTDPPPDPNEPRYCYCNGVSAGIMIACEGPDCKYQWFHIECLQMTEVPEEDYWCPDCTQAKSGKQARRRKKR